MVEDDASWGGGFPMRLGGAFTAVIFLAPTPLSLPGCTRWPTGGAFAIAAAFCLGMALNSTFGVTSGTGGTARAGRVGAAFIGTLGVISSLTSIVLVGGGGKDVLPEALLDDGSLITV